MISVPHFTDWCVWLESGGDGDIKDDAPVYGGDDDSGPSDPNQSYEPDVDGPMTANRNGKPTPPPPKNDFQDPADELNGGTDTIDDSTIGDGPPVPVGEQDFKPSDEFVDDDDKA